MVSRDGSDVDGSAWSTCLQMPTNRGIRPLAPRSVRPMTSEVLYQLSYGGGATSDSRRSYAVSNSALIRPVSTASLSAA